MITLRGTGDDGTEILALGVTRQNLRKLAEGEPIRVSAETHPGMPEKYRVLIFFGENERAITEDLKKHGLISDATKVIAVPRETGGDLPPEFRLPKDAIVARPQRVSMHMGADEHGMPVENPRENAERITREGDLVAAILKTPDGEMAVQVFGEPDVKLLEALDQARDGYRAVLERVGLLKPKGTKH
jgi:hypothetical protein